MTTTQANSGPGVCGILGAIVTAFVCVVLAPASVQAQANIQASVFGSGASAASANGTFLTGTVGQTFIGGSAASDKLQGAGFWYLFTDQVVITDLEEIESGVSTFALHENYPNPFSSETTISFSIRNPGRVTLDVYDILGKRVATIVDGVLPAGEFRTEWSSAGLSAGTYIYRLEASGATETGKMVIVR